MTKANSTKQDRYRDAGVDIDAGNAFVERIRPLIKRTRRPGVMSDIGMFAGFFAIDRERYREPLLVSGCDGVGTKLLIAAAMKKYDTIGIDVVAMCVNDVLVHGAEPLFFLDYIACGSLSDIDTYALVEGIAAGCEQARAALLGGETAEMPGVYGPGHFDLSGFAVGVVERDKVIDGSEVGVGSTIIGLASSGLHSNGYSLVRKLLLEQAGMSLDDTYPELGATLGETLLEPTRIYVRSVLQTMERTTVLAAAHITGGGLLENLPRVLPRSARAVIDFDSWSKPPIFSLLQRTGSLPDEEMMRVFNSGIGFVLVVPEEQAQDALDILAEQDERAWIIGHIDVRRDNQPVVVIGRTS